MSRPALVLMVALAGCASIRPAQPPEGHPARAEEATSPWEPPPPLTESPPLRDDSPDPTEERDSPHHGHSHDKHPPKAPKATPPKAPHDHGGHP